jgi:hypothetical protein
MRIQNKYTLFLICEKNEVNLPHMEWLRSLIMNLLRPGHTQLITYFKQLV